MAQKEIRSYRELIVWQKAVELVADIYRATNTFPRDEIYGLTSQLRRSAVSVPSNLLKGKGARRRASLFSFCVTRGGRSLNSKLRFSLRVSSVTSTRNSGVRLSANQRKWHAHLMGC